MMYKKILLLALTFAISVSASVAATPSSFLNTGRAGHAFDHLGSIGEQAEAAANSGANIIYATGLGSLGYSGLPDEKKLAKERKAVLEYNRTARSKGIKLIFGYVCATSIVKLDTFDKNWPEALRPQFKTAPSQWRQVGPDGKPLPSWYGGDYQPACMNHPDWRTYEKFVVLQQLASGHDGIFFDNPTVHPQGCYCRYCMGKFAGWLHERGKNIVDFSLPSTRELPAKYPKEFLQFRGEIARDFLTEMRLYARTIKSDALVTCNNSLNSPDVLFSQSRTYGYNIQEFSKAEDFILVEDMKSQPRMLSDGSTVEYGSTYRLLHAISHRKPVVAVTIADGDYHTPPQLVRLAMAEAAAHGASYLSWPTWPEKERHHMAKMIRPQADLLRNHEKILNKTSARADILVFLPFRRFVETEKCVAADMAALLTRSNFQYKVLSEDDFLLEINREAMEARLAAGRVRGETKAKMATVFSLPVFAIESRSILTPAETAALQKYEENGGNVIAADEKDWLKRIAGSALRSVNLKAPPSVRAVIQDQSQQTLVHLYNLGVERISSFEDKVHAVTNVEVKVRVPFKRVGTVTAFSADTAVPSTPLKFTTKASKTGLWVETTLPRLEISTILAIEP